MLCLTDSFHATKKSSYAIGGSIVLLMSDDPFSAEIGKEVLSDVKASSLSGCGHPTFAKGGKHKQNFLIRQLMARRSRLVKAEMLHSWYKHVTQKFK